MNLAPPIDPPEFCKDQTCSWLSLAAPQRPDELLADPTATAKLRRAAKPGKRIVLHGSPGSGKYTTARVIATDAGFTVSTVWAQRVGPAEAAGYAAHVLRGTRAHCVIIIGDCAQQLSSAVSQIQTQAETSTGGMVVAIVDEVSTAASKKLCRLFDATVKFEAAPVASVVKAVARAVCKANQQNATNWSRAKVSEIATDSSGDFRRALLYAYMHSLAPTASQSLSDPSYVPPPTGPSDAVRRIGRPSSDADRQATASGELILADRTLHTAAVAHSVFTSRASKRLRVIEALSDDDSAGFAQEAAYALGIAARRAQIRMHGFPTRASFGYAPVKTNDGLGYFHSS